MSLVSEARKEVNELWKDLPNWNFVITKRFIYKGKLYEVKIKEVKKEKVKE